MVAVMIVTVFAVSLAALLGFWAVIEGETSNPTVMDRDEAERRAIEQGGRGATGDSTDERSSDERDDDGVGWD